ncbi:hypothetical protein M0802_007229 [Mischocyttarus mexicanus]|nr:hypothetical protein M0802_007229 [Mischocyttarus mexicanus]
MKTLYGGIFALLRFTRPGHPWYETRQDKTRQDKKGDNEPGKKATPCSRLKTRSTQMNNNNNKKTEQKIEKEERGKRKTWKKPRRKMSGGPCERWGIFSVPHSFLQCRAYRHPTIHPPHLTSPHLTPLHSTPPLTFSFKHLFWRTDREQMYRSWL